jgi:TonB family protein
MRISNLVQSRTMCFLFLVVACNIPTCTLAQAPEKGKATSQEQKTDEKKPDTAQGGFEILSDTRGIDFRPYVESLKSKIYPAWLRLIPDVAREPVMKKGTAIFELNILKDGQMADLQLVQSSGDESMDRAPRMAFIAAEPLPQLPVAFRGDHLKIRCRFLYNPGKPANPSPDGQKK